MAGKTEYKNKWQSENCDRINLTVKKGSKQPLQDVAKEQGKKYKRVYQKRRAGSI